MFFDIAYGFEEKLKKSYSNEEEKNCIMALLKRLLKDKNLTIGVIAPYKSQVKDI
jgi:superfamily I DNA and/or RNA helicase